MSHIRLSPSFPTHLAHQPRRPLFVPGSAEARGAVKAARFRTVFVQLRASGVLRQLVTAPLFRLGLETGIEAAIGAGSPSKGQYHDERNRQVPPDASRLCRDQE